MGLACVSGTSVWEYCKTHLSTRGCSGSKDDRESDFEPDDEFLDENEKRDGDTIEEKEPYNLSTPKDSAADQSDRSASDIRSDNGGDTDSISMNEDDRRGPEPSMENIQEDKADISSDISD